MKLNPVLAHLANDLRQRGWSAETTASPDDWAPSNPAHGQCAVTALIVQDVFGGRLLRASVDASVYVGGVGGSTFDANIPPVSHYWNFVDGVEIDLTREQFYAYRLADSVVFRDRDYVLSYPETALRYQLLRERLGMPVEASA